MLEIKGVTKKFAQTSVLEGISFTLKKEEIFGVIGPDGAGKSTLLRILAGVLKPTEGVVLLENENIHTSKDIKEKISYMPQRFGLYEDLTVEENLHFIGRLFGISKVEREKRIEKLYNFSNLKPFKNRLAGKLSGGMKQKLGLMCALMHNPKLLILDEPTNGVDPISRREFWDILYELLKEGTSIVVSTAYLDEAERCNSIGILYNGRFLFCGKTDELSQTFKENFIEFHTDKPVEAAKILEEFSGLDFFVRGNSISLFTEDEEKTISLITSKLKDKISIEWVIKKPSLEDIFVKWIKESSHH